MIESGLVLGVAFVGVGVKLGVRVRETGGVTLGVSEIVAERLGVSESDAVSEIEGVDEREMLAVADSEREGVGELLIDGVEVTDLLGVRVCDGDLDSLTL